MAASITYSSKNIIIFEFQKKIDTEVSPNLIKTSSSYIIIGSIPHNCPEIPGTEVNLQEVKQAIREDILSLMSEATSLEEFTDHLLKYLEGYTAGLVDEDKPFSASFNLGDTELSVHISALEKLGFWECYIHKNMRVVEFLPTLDLTSDTSLAGLGSAIRKHG
ncbi:hypothetical protein ACN08Y_10150 [Rothia sp. P5764]|uniref:hypothetical protein n=1 Tax=Rothia sp. P5764 TaxID=3402654 RepID=UPI003AC96589